MAWASNLYSASSLLYLYHCITVLSSLYGLFLPHFIPQFLARTKVLDGHPDSGINSLMVSKKGCYIMSIKPVRKNGPFIVVWWEAFLLGAGILDILHRWPSVEFTKTVFLDFQLVRFTIWVDLWISHGFCRLYWDFLISCELSNNIQTQHKGWNFKH